MPRFSQTSSTSSEEHRSQSPDRDPLPNSEALSPSELRVLRYLPTNLTRPEIAQRALRLRQHGQHPYPQNLREARSAGSLLRCQTRPRAAATFSRALRDAGLAPARGPHAINLRRRLTRPRGTMVTSRRAISSLARAGLRYYASPTFQNSEPAAVVRTRVNSRRPHVFELPKPSGRALSKQPFRRPALVRTRIGVRQLHIGVRD